MGWELRELRVTNHESRHLSHESRNSPHHTRTLYSVGFEPGQHLAPAVFGCFLAIAGAVVGEEGMGGAFIDDDLRSALTLCQCRAHCLDGVPWDAGVRTA